MPAATHTGPVPIVVAVTGHRDLRPEGAGALTARIREFLEELRTAYPHSDLEVLSALAEGADRLAAHVALDLGLPLVVPLPMAIEDYTKDFADAASIAEFHALRARAARTFVVPSPDESARARPECYARLGAYIVRHCHVLLALWNGAPSDKVGGTAEIVRYRLEGVPPPYAGFTRALDPADVGVVHQIVTPRQSDPSTIGDPMTRKVIVSQETAAADRGDAHRAPDAAFRHICRSTDEFNRLAGRSGRGAEAQRRQCEDWLVGAFRERPFSPGLQALVATFTAADALAMRFQHRTLWTLRGLFVFVFGAIVAFEMFAHDPLHGHPGPIVLYVALLAGAYVVYQGARRQGFDTKYLDYRALAEGLRVQFYWRLAGMSAAAADYHMRSSLDDVEWIRLALRRHDGSDEAGATAPDRASDEEALRLVVREWVDGQHRFFVKARARDHRQLARWERWTTVLVWISIVVGVAAMIGAVLLGRARSEHLIESRKIAFVGLVALIGLSSAAAAMAHGYTEKRALSAHIKRYGRMTGLFRAARRALDDLMRKDAWPAARLVLTDLGREALEENAEWVILHRERPLEVPQ